MRVLLSLPPKLANHFHELEKVSHSPYFCSHDPIESKLGSGGGSSYLLHEAWKSSQTQEDLENWLEMEQRILIHAGGQSRRLPAYAPMGKLLTPIPLLPGIKGQNFRQHLLDLQLPLLEELLEKAPPKLNTLIACGDAWVRNEGKLPFIPEADVVFLGMWAKANIASKHGVFFCPRTSRNEWAFALQKPSEQKILELSEDYHYLVDVGICMLSKKALELLFKKSAWQKDRQAFQKGIPDFYDLYGEFAQYLGSQARKHDPEFAQLSYALVPLPSGEFHHFGSSRDLIRSTKKLSSPAFDTNEALSDSLFSLNAQIGINFNQSHSQIWIENSYIGPEWNLSNHHLITGVPQNDWKIQLGEGICLDIIPIEEDKYCIRPYGFEDIFRGNLHRAHWMGQEVQAWMARKSIRFEEAGLDQHIDIQEAALFPVLTKEELKGGFVQWMIDGREDEAFKKLWLRQRLSATKLSEDCNLKRLYAQREYFFRESLSTLSPEQAHKYLPLLDLADLAKEFQRLNLSPDHVQGGKLKMSGIAESMLKSEYEALQMGSKAVEFEAEAFSRLRFMFLDYIQTFPAFPQKNLLPDQLLIAKAPLRMDLAGGWSDTPPYCLNYGGRVVNVAIEINGQAPIQVTIKSTEKNHFLLRSIDQGKEEKVDDFFSLARYDQLGEAFAIPKAALALAGFSKDFSQEKSTHLSEKIQAAGGGIELTTLAAVPQGSGLGTSSILAAAVLAALSEVYQLDWTQEEICHRVLVLEQMLTSGGGWQDQYGGIFPGIKYLKTRPGLGQEVKIRQLSEEIWADSEYKPNMLLYYTGITRVAHNILGEIVRSMFLNTDRHMRNIHKIYQHGKDTNKVVKQEDYFRLADMVAKSWELNKDLDPGTNPPEIEKIFAQIDPYLLGAKLLGAGGGGFLFIMARDQEAAQSIKSLLEEHPPNARARFVDFAISQKGLEIIRT